VYLRIGISKKQTWFGFSLNERAASRKADREEKAVDDVLVVLDRALRSEFSAPSELGRLADVFGRVREERRG
jgi:hypothetical protein